MVPSNIADNFRADPQLFIMTRWTQINRSNQTSMHPLVEIDVVEIVHTKDGSSLCVGVGSSGPLRSFWVLNTELLSDTSAFNYIGTASELAFIQLHTWLYRLELLWPTQRRIGQIRSIEGNLVRLADTIPPTDASYFYEAYDAILRTFRVASSEEVIEASRPPSETEQIQLTVIEEGIGPLPPNPIPNVIEELPRTYGRLTSWDILDFESDI